MLSQLIETYPTFAEAWNRRASLYYVLKRYDAAMIDIEKAIALEPRNFGALIGKGMILLAQNRSDEAVAALKEMLFGRASSIFGGSNEIQKNIISKAVLGL